MRVVSLIASATEILHGLGLGEYQVGRSHECDYPPSVLELPACTRPRFPTTGSSAEIDRLAKQTLVSVGSVYEVFEDILQVLEPTHILTQTQCKVCAVSLDDVERALSGRFPTRPRVVALEPNSLADIWNDIRRVATACERSFLGDALVDRLQNALSAIERKAAAAGVRPRVACIEWQDPLMYAGHWTPELIRLASGDPCTLTADPDVILVAPCGSEMERTASEMRSLESRPEWPDLRAVRARRVYLADGNRYFNRPGPRLLDTCQIVAEILHPSLFPPTLEGSAWQSALT
jgi:iron complex transport system substrate-binding protein